VPEHLVTTTLDGGGAPFRIAATEHGVAAAGWQPDPDRFEAELWARFRTSAVDLDDARPNDPAAILLRDVVPVFRALLEGARVDGEAFPVDVTDRPAWDQRVLGEVRRVAWGETASYGDIAKRLGAPRAARAVGGALGRNPISLLIPCHRIIAGDGTLGGYGGTGWVDRDRQLSRKEALLLREGIVAPRRAV
jgi:O-6-methylguanine DNA methyltransferase